MKEGDRTLGVTDCFLAGEQGREVQFLREDLYDITIRGSSLWSAYNLVKVETLACSSFIYQRRHP